MNNVQHKESFIATLVLHIRIPLMQQKIVTQSDVVEIMMKLEASPIGETRVGMNHIQSQLEKLTIQFQDINKGRELRENVWCTQCQTERHHKDQPPYFLNYLLSGAPNSLNQGGLPWCQICQTSGH